MSTLARAFVSQIVIDFVASQPNASGELGAVHIRWLILAKTPRELLWPFARRHLREEVRQFSTLGGRGITVDRIHLSLDKLPIRLSAERSAENTRNKKLNFDIFGSRLAEYRGYLTAFSGGVPNN